MGCIRGVGEGRLWVLDFRTIREENTAWMLASRKRGRLTHTRHTSIGSCVLAFRGDKGAFEKCGGPKSQSRSLPYCASPSTVHTARNPVDQRPGGVSLIDQTSEHGEESPGGTKGRGGTEGPIDLCVTPRRPCRTHQSWHGSVICTTTRATSSLVVIPGGDRGHVSYRLPPPRTIVPGRRNECSSLSFANNVYTWTGKGGGFWGWDSEPPPPFHPRFRLLDAIHGPPYIPRPVSIKKVTT